MSTSDDGDRAGSPQSGPTGEMALSPGFHMVGVRSDIVILDVSADHYACLAGARDLIALPRPGVVRAREEVLAELAAQGLVTPNHPVQARKAPLPVEGALAAERSGGPLLTLVTAARIFEATAAFRDRPLAALTAPARPARRRPPRLCRRATG